MADQVAIGHGIAQASGGSTAIVNVFQRAEAAPIPEAVLAEAIATFETLLPVDEVPEPQGLPSRSRMPYSRNRQFVGREPDLQAIARALKAGGTAAVGETTALTGMGGIGKTQLAAEFAFRYGRWFEGGVFWLSFADQASIAAEIASSGGPRALNLHESYDSLPLEGQVGLVAAAWQSNLPRLLVFDNCEDEALLEALAAAERRCQGSRD